MWFHLSAAMKTKHLAAIIFLASLAVQLARSSSGSVFLDLLKIASCRPSVSYENSSPSADLRALSTCSDSTDTSCCQVCLHWTKHTRNSTDKDDIMQVEIPVPCSPNIISSSQFSTERDTPDDDDGATDANRGNDEEDTEVHGMSTQTQPCSLGVKLLHHVLEISVVEQGETITSVGSALWQEAYHILTLLEKLFRQFPYVYFQETLESLWELLSACLLHQHVWVREVSSRLLDGYFTASSAADNDSERLRLRQQVHVAMQNGDGDRDGNLEAEGSDGKHDAGADGERDAEADAFAKNNNASLSVGKLFIGGLGHLAGVTLNAGWFRSRLCFNWCLWSILGVSNWCRDGGHVHIIDDVLLISAF